MVFMSASPCFGANIEMKYYLDGYASIYSKNIIEVEIYNGESRSVEGLTLLLSEEKEGGGTVSAREYSCVFWRPVQPNASGKCEAKLFGTLSRAYKYDVEILEVDYRWLPW